MVRPRGRTQNVFVCNGKSLVAKVAHLNGDYLPDTIREALNLLGGVDKGIRTGDHVLIKPNFHAAQPLPFSTDRAFLGGVLEILLDAGATVTVGDRLDDGARRTMKP